jgi:pyruvate dehydrogenase E1 component alpha subunit
MTYRFRGHFEGDSETYRTREDVEAWMQRDPLVTFPRRLVAEGVADDETLRRLADEARAEVDAAAERALGGARPAPERVRDFVYADAAATARDRSAPWPS